ncbi:MAG: riboflavin synthase [Candidatus Hydrogenedentota bacterium]
MFTGIIREVGRVVGCETMPGGIRLNLAAPDSSSTARLGDSIAIDGCCLTVTEVSAPRLAFELSGETLNRTIAGAYREGSHVNLEGSLRVGDTMGGHFVTGHVDRVASVRALKHEGEFAVLSVKLDAEHARGFVAEKGSIGVNGVSLTVSSWNASAGVFEVALIPATLSATNLSDLSEGSCVNIEYDLIARYLKEMTQARFGKAGISDEG